MGLHGFPEYDDRSNPPSLSDFRRLGEMARRLQTPDAGAGSMDAGESGFAYTPPPDLSLWARLTAAGTGTYLGKYSWKQVQDDGTGAAVDVPGGMQGAYDGSTGPPAQEVMLTDGLAADPSAGQVVRMWLAESGDFYWFDHPKAPASALAVAFLDSPNPADYTGVARLDFDPASLFTLVLVTAGEVRVGLPFAGAGQGGLIFPGDQYLVDGTKSFAGAAFPETTTPSTTNDPMWVGSGTGTGRVIACRNRGNTVDRGVNCSTVTAANGVFSTSVKYGGSNGQSVTINYTKVGGAAGSLTFTLGGLTANT
jgi:hypothetical protein